MLSINWSTGAVVDKVKLGQLPPAITALAFSNTGDLLFAGDRKVQKIYVHLTVLINSIGNRTYFPSWAIRYTQVDSKNNSFSKTC